MSYGGKYQREHVDELKATAGLASPPRSHEWILHVHPEGYVYFYNPRLRIVTDEDVRLPDTYDAVMRNCRQYPVSMLNDDMEVHLNGLPPEDTASFNLVANHKHCIASYDLHEVTDSNVSALSLPNLNRRRRLYYSHLQSHPSHVPTATSERATREAVDALTWFHTDNLISGSKSTVPFSNVECQELLRLLRESKHAGENSAGRIVFLAWLLREITRFRDAEDYGQHTLSQWLDRRKFPTHLKTSPVLDRDPKHWNLLVEITSSVACFGIPSTYLGHIEAASEYQGRLSNVQDNWDGYINRLVKEYSDFLLIATVLLSATVGFLSVSDVGQASKSASIVSAFCSLSSIIIGCFLMWRHSIYGRMSHSFIYMHNARHGRFGLPGHAMVLSLPPVFLVWAVVTFGAALVAFTLQDLAVNSAAAWTVCGIFILLFFIVVSTLRAFSVIWRFHTPSISWGFRGIKRPKAQHPILPA